MKMVPHVQINGKHQIPSYTYSKLKTAICATGSTASACSSVEEIQELCPVA